MSATDKTAAVSETGAVAHVDFRVRCESLGFGEEVYLVADDQFAGHHKVGKFHWLESAGSTLSDWGLPEATRWESRLLMLFVPFAHSEPGELEEFDRSQWFELV